jgi:hypothetical protein
METECVSCEVQTECLNIQIDCVETPRGDGFKHLRHSTAVVGGDEKEPSAREYNWATLFLKDM